jgi:hypothetical protein
MPQTEHRTDLDIEACADQTTSHRFFWTKRLIWALDAWLIWAHLTLALPTSPLSSVPRCTSTSVHSAGNRKFFLCFFYVLSMFFLCSFYVLSHLIVSSRFSHFHINSHLSFWWRQLSLRPMSLVINVVKYAPIEVPKMDWQIFPGYA